MFCPLVIDLPRIMVTDVQIVFNLGWFISISAVTQAKNNFYSKKTQASETNWHEVNPLYVEPATSAGFLGGHGPTFHRWPVGSKLWDDSLKWCESITSSSWRHHVRTCRAAVPNHRALDRYWSRTTGPRTGTGPRIILYRAAKTE